MTVTVSRSARISARSSRPAWGPASSTSEAHAMARLLLTRPEMESAALRQRLLTAGHTVDAAPMLAIRSRHDVSLSLEGVTALLFTSANGLRAFCDATPRRDF